MKWYPIRIENQLAKQGRYSVGEERARMVTLSDDERARDDERPHKIER